MPEAQAILFWTVRLSFLQFNDNANYNFLVPRLFGVSIHFNIKYTIRRQIVLTNVFPTRLTFNNIANL